MACRNLAQGLQTQVVAFDGDRLIAQGEAGDVALRVKHRIESDPQAQILVFDDATSRVVEIDYGGTEEDVRRFVASWGRLPQTPSPLAREVTLLPRHWDWLEEQPGGAAAALRRLVDEARKGSKDVARRAQEAAYRFVLTMAGDRPGFEEATRALFAGDSVRFHAQTEGWPEDVRDRAWTLAARSVMLPKGRKDRDPPEQSAPEGVEQTNGR